MIEKIAAVLSLLPALISAARAIEEAIPMSGQGKAKAQIVLDSVSAVSEHATELLPTLEKVLSIIVTAFNALGIFKK